MTRVPRSAFIRHLIYEVRKTGMDIRGDHVAIVYQRMLDTIMRALCSGNYSAIDMDGFGAFELRVRKAKVLRQPSRPGSDKLYPPTTYVRFVPNRIFKKRIKRVPAEKVSSV